MLQAMFNGVSGVQAHKTELDIIGNNVANVNTVAFKASRTVFKDVISQTIRSATQPSDNGLGGTNPFQVGLGVQVGAADLILSQGSMQPTGKITDVAIEGNGFLMATDGVQRYFTRDGSFYVDSAGNLVSTGSGMHVLGWTADALTGQIDTSETITPTSTIKILVGQTSIAQATTKVEMGGNLEAAATPGTLYPKTFDIYDSHGVKHPLTINFVKSATTPAQKATWFWYAASPDQSEATPATYVADTTNVAATIRGTAAQTGTYTAGGTLRFNDVNGSPVVTVTIPAGPQSITDIRDAINTAMAGVAPPYRITASVTGGVISLTNTTAGYTGVINVDTNPLYTTPGLLSFMNLSSATLGVGEARRGNFQPPNDTAQPITINHVTLYVDPSDTAASLAQKINKSGAGVIATATADGRINLTSMEIGTNASIVVTGSANYNISQVFGSNPTSTPSTGYSIGSGLLTFDTSGNSEVHTVPISLTLARPDGAVNPVTINLDLSKIQQLAGADTVAAQTQDGLSLGTLESFSIGKDGIITGRFTNGISKSLAQLAMADFRNSAGLAKSGNNLWLETSNSGLAQVGVPNNGSRGRITAGFLESSNVDLPTEFTNMIVAQRGFQANARLITTSDEVLQELVQLKR